MWKEISKVAGCMCVCVLRASGRKGVSADNLRSYRPWYGLWILFCTQSLSHVWLFAILWTACQAPLGCKAIPFWVRWFEQGSDFMFLQDSSNSKVANFGFLWIELRKLMNLDENIRRLTISSVDQDVYQPEHSYTAFGNIKLKNSWSILYSIKCTLSFSIAMYLP